MQRTPLLRFHPPSAPRQAADAAAASEAPPQLSPPARLRPDDVMRCGAPSPTAPQCCGHDAPHTACACVPFAAQPFAADGARAAAPQAPLLARVADAEMSSLLPPGRALLPLPALGRRSTRRRRLLSFKLFILLFFYAAQHILRRRSQYVLHRPEKRARKEAGRDGPQGPPARAPEECLVFIQVVLILVGQTRITTKT